MISSRPQALSHKRRMMRSFAALAVVPLVSGCVVAALPVLAAGGLIGTQTGGDDDPSSTRGPPRVAIDLSTADTGPVQSSPGPLVQNYTLKDGTKVEVMSGRPSAPAIGPQDPGTVPTAPAPLARITEEFEAERVSAGVTAAPATLPVLRAPIAKLPVDIVGRVLPASGAGLGPAEFAGYDGLYGYTAQQAVLPIGSGERRSALLADPGSLSPATRQCSIHPAALLIDLDPVAAVIDPAKAVHADPRLVGTLAALREGGVTIGWLSASTADRAGAIRRVLVASGLDAAGRDELALLRYPEERKQTRRADFAREFCVVAIAGDERGDFDEVFQYLKNPALAAPLEALLGDVWFLIPQPLS